VPRVPSELPAKFRFDHARLRQIREARGWRREDIAVRFPCSVSLVTEIELGHRRVTAERAATLALVYGCHVDDLLVPVDEPDELGV
jgi:transcriptional regulator with XRE-family HTH domain